MTQNNDLLYKKAKELYPNATEDEIQQGLTSIRESAPDASDDEIINAASTFKQKQDDGSLYKELAISKIKEKYFGPEYSDEARQKLQDQVNAQKSDFGQNLLRAGMRFGEHTAGRSGEQADRTFDQQNKNFEDATLGKFDRSRQDILKNFETATKFKDAELDQTKKAAESDPNSVESKLAKDLAISMGMKPELVANLTAARFKEFSPVLQKKYEIAERAKDRQEAREDRNYQRNLKMEEKRNLANEKKKTTLNEVEDRRRNIEDNLALVEKQIQEKGTYELFGSHNADLDRRIEAIATDMAKLADPNSVARPSEVENFKKGLVQSNMASMSNSTALNILKNFRKEVQKRADNAYRVRGIENPNGGTERTVANESKKTPSKPKTITQNGHTYVLNEETGDYE